MDVVNSVRGMLDGLCQQALIYFWVSVVVSMLAYLRSYDSQYLVLMLLWVPAYTYVVNFMCKKNYKVLAWVFGLFPIIGFLVNLASGVLQGVSAGVKKSVDNVDRSADDEGKEHHN
jgi:hypothetical protein